METAAEVISNAHLHRRILNLAQDILYLSSNAKYKLPKHVGLAILVKNLNGSWQIINILHRQCNAVSFDDVCPMKAVIVSQFRSEIRRDVMLINHLTYSLAYLFMLRWTTLTFMRMLERDKD